MEEVERGAVPVGVAGLVEVDVVGQLARSHGVGGSQPRAIFHAVDVVEGGAGGVRVACAAAGQGAVGAGSWRQVESVAGRLLLTAPQLSTMSTYGPASVVVTLPLVSS